MSSRRGFLQNLLVGAGIFASAKALSAQEASVGHGREQILTKRKRETAASEHGGDTPVSVLTPDVPELPFRMDGNGKELKSFEDTTDEVKLVLVVRTDLNMGKGKSCKFGIIIQPCRLQCFSIFDH